MPPEATDCQSAPEHGYRCRSRPARQAPYRLSGRRVCSILIYLNLHRLGGLSSSAAPLQCSDRLAESDCAGKCRHPLPNGRRHRRRTYEPRGYLRENTRLSAVHKIANASLSATVGSRNQIAGGCDCPICLGFAYRASIDQTHQRGGERGFSFAVGSLPSHPYHTFRLGRPAPARTPNVFCYRLRKPMYLKTEPSRFRRLILLLKQSLPA